MPEIKQTLGFDAAQAIQTLAKLDAAMQGVRTRFSSTAKAMGTFNAKAGKTEAILKRLKTSASGAATQMSRLNRATPTSSGTNTALNNTATQMNKVGAAASVAGNQSAAAIEKADKSTKSWTISWQTLGRVVATQAIVRALNAIRNTLSDAVTDAVKFQKAVAEIGTIGDELSGLEGIEDMVRRVSDVFNVDLADTAEAAYQTVSNQIAKTEGDVESFLGSAAKFSKITKTDMTTAVNLLSGTLNAFGKSVSETEDVAAKFFNTIKLGRTRAEELAKGMGTINPIAYKLGISMEELNAAVATLTIQGLKTDKVVTQIRGAMQAFLKPTEDMKDALKELGFATGEQVFEAYDLQQAIRKVTSTTDGSAAAVAKLFPRIRGLTGVLGLAADESNHFVKSLEEQKDALGAVYDEAYNLVITTDAEKVTKSMNKLKNVLIDVFGQKFLSGVANLFGSLEGLATSEVELIARAYDERGKAHADLLEQELKNEQAALDERAKILAQYAAVARKEFLNAAKAAEDANLVITASTQWAIDSMLGPVEAAVKAITTAISESGKLQQSFADSATSTHEDLQKTLFGRSISVTDDPNVKVSLLRKKSAEESVKAQLLAASATTDAELKIAEALQKSSRAYNDQAFSISKSIKKKYVNGEATRDLTKRELELQKRLTSQVNQDAIKLQDRYRISTEKGADATAKGTKGLAESGREIIEYKANLENLVKTMQEAQEKASDADLTPADQAKLAKEAQTAVDAYLDTYAKGIEKFADSADPLVKKLFQDIDAQDKTVEIDTIMTLPSNMEEIFGMIRSASESFFKKIPVEVKLFAAERGLEVDTPKQVDEAMRQYNETLKEQVAAAGAAKQAQSTLDNELLKIKATLDSLSDDVVGGLDTIDEEAGIFSADYWRQRFLPSATKEFISAIDELRTGLKEGFTDGGIKSITASLEKAAEGGFSTVNALTALNDSLIKLPGLQKVVGAGLDLPELETSKEIAAGGFGKDYAISVIESKLAQLEVGVALDANKAKIDANIQSQRQLNAAIAEGAAKVQAPEATQQTDVAVKQLETSENGVGTAINANVVAQDQVTAATDRSTAAAERHLSIIKSIRSVPQTINNPNAEFNAHGGRVGYFASGGQGTDTINAMLSKGEHVTNAKSSRRFFSQLQAMNAGQNPVLRSEGGDTYNTNVGDINVSGGGNPQVAAREVMKAIRREERRGSGR